MKSLTDHLAAYAAYHRDRRNVALHFAGIPLIVVGVEVLLSRGGVAIGPSTTLPWSALISVAAALFYLRLDLRLGLVMVALLALACWAGTAIARQPQAIWLGCGIGLFALGWSIQFVGHVYEGRKPAFVDDVIGLLIGPLFVVAEMGFLLGLRSDLHYAIEARQP